MSAFQQLESLLGPPRGAVTPVPWEESSQEIGIQFPADYRRLIDTYGQISINGELHIFGPTQEPSEPGAPVGFQGFQYDTTNPDSFCGVLAEYYAAGDFEKCPYPLFPAPGGILKWASNYNSDHLFWLTEGDDPDRWPIVIVYRAGLEWERFDGTVTELLVQVLTGDYPDAGGLVGAGFNVDAPKWTVLGDWAGWAA